jgi:hypothetical protein
MQSNPQLTTTPPLPGIVGIPAINAAIGTVATDFSGATDPAAFAWAFSKWADTATGLLKRRNAANTAWVVVGEIFPSAGTHWLGKAIGEIFYLRDDLAGVTAPPNTSASFRFIKLTASDPYNSGVLTGESVSGSAPLVVATATISLAGSPINGASVNLINTERRILRAGSSGTVQNDSIQNITGSTGAYYRATNSGSTGAFTATQFGPTPAVNGTAGSNPGDAASISFDASLSVRTSTETRPKNQGVTAYMRIL